MRSAAPRLLVAAVLVVLSDSPVLGDTPAHPYTVNLGPGNRDLEKQINAIPWTNRPELRLRVKDVSSVSFAGRDLRLSAIHFEMNGLYSADFTNCNLDGSTLRETRFVNCSFRGASLRYCEMDLFSEDPAAFNDFTDAAISGSWLHAFPGECLAQTRNFQSRRLIGTQLGGDMSGLSFRDFLLCNAILVGPVDRCVFDNATMQRTMVFDNLSRQQLYSTMNYKRKDFTTVLFSGWGARRKGDFSGWDLSRCSLSYFLNCDLTHSSFDGALFLKTKATQVRAPTSRNSLYVRLYYSMVKLADIGFDNCLVTEAQLRETVNWQRKDLRGMHLKNMPLDGWDPAWT